MARYNKDYSGDKEEYHRRKLNFQANLFMVRRHNIFEFNKTAGYRLTVNFMSDWDQEENSGWFYGLGDSEQRQRRDGGSSDRRLLG